MKKIHRVWALLLAALMVIGLMTTAFAEPTIDPAKKASLSIYRYDITKAGNDGAWNAESYVSTGLHDDAVIEKLSKYAIQGVEFTYLRIADITITACNNAGFVLPFTGGTGFTTYIVLAALMLCMGVYFCKRSNIKKETTE